MTINDYMKRVGISREELLETSGIPESTLSDILNGVSNIENCQSRTLRKLSKALSLPIEQIMKLEPVTDSMPNPAFSPFHTLTSELDYQISRGLILRNLKVAGGTNLVAFVLQAKIVEQYYEDEDYAAALFLIGLVDLICDEQGMPRVTRYDAYRGDMMAKPLYPVKSNFAQLSDNEKSDMRNNALPQLARFNIIETYESLYIK